MGVVVTFGVPDTVGGITVLVNSVGVLSPVVAVSSVGVSTLVKSVGPLDVVVVCNVFVSVVLSSNGIYVDGDLGNVVVSTLVERE